MKAFTEKTADRIWKIENLPLNRFLICDFFTKYGSTNDLCCKLFIDMITFSSCLKFKDILTLF